MDMVTRLTSALGSVFFICALLAAPTTAQNVLAEDNADNYSGDTYLNENQGVGFDGSFIATNFGADDQGEAFLEDRGREVDGTQSFGLFANDEGTGAAISRSLSTPLDGDQTYRIRFLTRFDLDVDGGQTAGFYLSEQPASAQSDVSDGQQLFIGSNGSGNWGFDEGDGFEPIRSGTDDTTFSINEGDGDNAGDIYEVRIDVQPEQGRFDVQIINQTTDAASVVESGTLTGNEGAPVSTIGAGNGVVDFFRDLIFDDIQVIEDPVDPLRLLRAADEAETYTDSFTDTNNGLGFDASFTPVPFDSNQSTDAPDNTFLTDASRALKADQSFGLFASETPPGAALARSLETPLQGSTRQRIRMRVQFDLDTNAGQTAGIVLSGTAVNDLDDVFDGQRLFVGIDGSGEWGVDGNAGFQALTDGNGDALTVDEDAVYELTVEVRPELGSFDVQVQNLNTLDRSAIASGNLSGSAPASITTLGIANGVVGDEQDLIFDRIAVSEDPPDFPLPVELTSFTAALDGTTAQLRWKTASETDNAGFEVQHAAGNSDFQALDFVEGYGTTDAPRHYSFTVDNLEPGTHQFRLKQIDFDGTSELTEIRTVEVGLTDPVVLDPVAPNPVRTQSTIRFAVQDTEPVTVSVYNVLGQRVKTLYDGTPSPGQIHELTLDGQSMASGTYFVRIEGASIQETQRMTVVR